MSGNNHQYAFFLGCIAPNRYPGIEAAAIRTSKNVGIDLLPLKGASCCPAPGAFGSIDLNVWYAMAARNIVLAEQMGMDIALVCNGCYKSIWEVNHKLKHNDELRDGVNEVLKEIDMEYKGTIDVWHLAELYYDPEVVGVKKLADSVKRPLTGAKVAVHYGCHLMKPRKERHFGNTEEPMWMEELVAALVLRCRRRCPWIRYHARARHHQREADQYGRSRCRCSHRSLSVLPAPVRPRPDRDQ